MQYAVLRYSTCKDILRILSSPTPDRIQLVYALTKLHTVIDEARDAAKNRYRANKSVREALDKAANEIENILNIHCLPAIEDEDWSTLRKWITAILDVPLSPTSAPKRR